MENSQRNQISDNSITQLPIAALRQKWAELWGVAPHARIGRTMLEKSLEFRLWEQETGGISAEQQSRLDNLVASYKRNRNFFDENMADIKPGTRIVRAHKGQRHSVLVSADGYEYKDKKYSSLSEVAFAITGTRWNGWTFFGLKRRAKK